MTDLIKTMKLYVQVERVFNELRDLGFSDSDPVPVETLTQFDQYHYDGTHAVDHAIRACGIQVSHQILEVGAGIGGPARYLASQTKCQVTALELQADLNEIGRHLTKRSGLSDLIDHQVGDFLDADPPLGQYDALVSWLAFLHIPNRKLLFERCFAHLKPGAKIYIEDFVKLGPFSLRETQDLEEKIFCHYVPAVSEYIDQLEDAGFVSIENEDMSAQWTDFVRSRLDNFRANRDRHLNIHGPAIVDGLDDFYSTMASLYEGRNLGGIRLVARKPLHV